LRQHHREKDNDQQAGTLDNKVVHIAKIQLLIKASRSKQSERKIVAIICNCIQQIIVLAVVKIGLLLLWIKK
jgi:hypothetical protein